MAVDYNILSQFKSKSDYDQAAQEFQLRKQLAAAQLAKANELDLDKVGETAFAKIANGVPLSALSPTERAGAQWVQNKSGGVVMDAAGNMVQKPKIFDGIGLPQPTQPNNNFLANNNVPPEAPAKTPEGNAAILDIFGNGQSSPTATPAAAPVQNEWDAEFKQQYAALAGNPKAQQDLLQSYSKSKISMNESESKNATFADRIQTANQRLADPKIVAAGGDPWENVLGAVPLVNKYLTSPEYQMYDAARTDYTTARLRPESGATINPSEFADDKKIAIPQPGDSQELLAQKAANRAAIAKGVARAAGPAYKPTEVITPAKASPASSIPMAAAKHLKDNPALRDQFDAKYGAGASKLVLGK